MKLGKRAPDLSPVLFLTTDKRLAALYLAMTGWGYAAW
jgi:hypothetical protein